MVDVLWWSRMNGRCWVSYGVMFEFCNLSVNLKPLMYSFSRVSALTVHIAYLSSFRLLRFFKYVILLHSRIISAILRACGVAWHCFTFSGYIVGSHADFGLHEVPRRIDIEERGRVASLSRMMDGYLWKWYTAYLHARCQRELFANDLNVSESVFFSQIFLMKRLTKLVWTDRTERLSSQQLSHY